ncbi:ead/Ea22-like family protein [Escherichia marmotae]|uniref:ead/Ea22-like family protein n=1 Tax=Escherichia marmotae TaxID=1499973 RepID=UPI002E20212E|nr:ead/Ea22-like family protein [Escherichia marmotae]
MSKIDYQVLREAAEKATKGSYIIGHTSVNQHGNLTGVFVCQKWKGEPGGVIAECHVNCLVETDAQAYANAEFIAAANPATVLALLDELDHYKSREERVTKLVMDNSTSWDALYKKLEDAEKRNAKLQSENAYIRNRYKELDLLIGKNILVMQAAIIEWQSTGDAKSGLAWIYNTLFGPGELPDESEKDAQAYFNRKYAPIDEKLMALHKWFWEQSEAERAAANIGVKGK